MATNGEKLTIIRCLCLYLSSVVKDENYETKKKKYIYIIFLK